MRIREKMEAMNHGIYILSCRTCQCGTIGVVCVCCLICCQAHQKEKQRMSKSPAIVKVVGWDDYLGVGVGGNQWPQIEFQKSED